MTVSVPGEGTLFDSSRILFSTLAAAYPRLEHTRRSCNFMLGSELKLWRWALSIYFIVRLDPRIYAHKPAFACTPSQFQIVACGVPYLLLFCTPDGMKFPLLYPFARGADDNEKVMEVILQKFPSRYKTKMEWSSSCSFQLAKKYTRTNPHCNT